MLECTAYSIEPEYKLALTYTLLDDTLTMRFAFNRENTRRVIPGGEK